MCVCVCAHPPVRRRDLREESIFYGTDVLAAESKIMLRRAEQKLRNSGKVRDRGCCKSLEIGFSVFAVDY